MTDLHGWITQQIDRAEKSEPPHNRACRSLPDTPSCCGATDCDCAQYDSTGPCDCGWPARMLRRYAADRKILADHAALGFDGGVYCVGCGVDYESGPHVENINDCPTLLALAEGYGLTPDVLAGLDRPELPEPKRRGPVPDTRRVPPALRGPNWSSR